MKLRSIFYLRPTILLFCSWRVWWILSCHSGAVACSLFRVNSFLQFPLCDLRISASSRFGRKSQFIKQMQYCLTLSELLMKRQELGLGKPAFVSPTTTARMSPNNTLLRKAGTQESIY